MIRSGTAVANVAIRGKGRSDTFVLLKAGDGSARLGDRTGEVDRRTDPGVPDAVPRYASLRQLRKAHTTRRRLTTTDPRRMAARRRPTARARPELARSSSPVSPPSSAGPENRNRYGGRHKGPPIDCPHGGRLPR